MLRQAHAHVLRQSHMVKQPHIVRQPHILRQPHMVRRHQLMRQPPVVRQRAESYGLEPAGCLLCVSCAVAQHQHGDSSKAKAESAFELI